MTVQYSPGPIAITPSDFQRIDRGIHWAIKCREADNGAQAVYVCVKNGATWTIAEALDDGFEIHILNDHGGDVQKWLRERLLPALNSWLARFFPAGTEPIPQEPLPVSNLERADAAIRGITIMVMPDGTLGATV